MGEGLPASTGSWGCGAALPSLAPRRAPRPQRHCAGALAQPTTSARADHGLHRAAATAAHKDVCTRCPDPPPARLTHACAAPPPAAPRAKPAAPPAGLWLAANPSKRWAEVFYLAYSPFWILWALCILVPFQLYEVGRGAGRMRSCPGAMRRQRGAHAQLRASSWRLQQRAACCGRPSKKNLKLRAARLQSRSTWMSGATWWWASPRRCPACCCRPCCQTRCALFTAPIPPVHALLLPARCAWFVLLNEADKHITLLAMIQADAGKPWYDRYWVKVRAAGLLCHHKPVLNAFAVGSQRVGQPLWLAHTKKSNWFPPRPMSGCSFLATSAITFGRTTFSTCWAQPTPSPASNSTRCGGRGGVLRSHHLRLGRCLRLLLACAPQRLALDHAHVLTASACKHGRSLGTTPSPRSPSPCTS